ncbi:MAG: heparinase II/III family protein [Armatimonadetes bacterium]|nr:heparinase II/III family protein [Armatimonadota bacterium]
MKEQAGWVWATLVGATSLAAAVGSPQDSQPKPVPGAAEEDSGVVWPQEWTAFGLMRRSGDPYVRPNRNTEIVSGDLLKTIPVELEVRGEKFPGRKLKLEDGYADLYKTVFSDKAEPPGAMAYLMAPITATRDVTIQIGAGAGYFMHWWVDGTPVYDTFERGNGPMPATIHDHLFGVSLTKGQHILAVAVIHGAKTISKFDFAAAGPDELRAHPWTFEQAMDAGRRTYATINSRNIDFGAAHRDFEQAAGLAADDSQRAEARLSIARNDLSDMATTDFAAIRQECAAVLALKDAGADQKAKAELVAGEAWLRENRSDLARAAFDRGLKLCPTDETVSAQAHLDMGRAYIQEGNLDAARAELTPLLAVVNPGNKKTGIPHLPFDARLLLEAIDVGARIRPDHPRMFFNEETWPAVKARILADPDGFGELKKDVAALPAQPHVRNWGMEAMKAALVYRVTGDREVLDKTRRLIRASADYNLTWNDANARIEGRVACASALDWIWNDIAADERDGIARDLVRYALGVHTSSEYVNKASNIGMSNYEPNAIWFTMLGVFNPEWKGAERLRALTLLGRGYDNYMRTFAEDLELMRDRGARTRLEYGLAYVPADRWTFMYCWRSAVGPLPKEWAFAASIVPSYILRNIVGMGIKEGGYIREYGYNDTYRTDGGWMGSLGTWLYDYLGFGIDLFGKAEPEEARIAAWLRERMAEAGFARPGYRRLRTGSMADYPIYPYIVGQEGNKAEPTLPEGLPPARLYSMNGNILMSSGFSPDATYAFFVCGTREGGRGPGESGFALHFDAAHFIIYKKGYLALDSGTRGSQLTPHESASVNYDEQSVAHNTVLIRMPGEVFRSRRSTAGAADANSGGQYRLPQSARVIAFETDRLFTYAATDATPTYHEEKCAQMVRQFIWLSPDHFVVFDRVTSKNADYPKTWLLHTGREPVVTGKEFRADQGEGRIFCRTLLPADGALEKIGGPGKEFWADGRNWPVHIPERHDAMTRMKGAPVKLPLENRLFGEYDVAENMGRWRVEVKPAAAREEDYFLHLIQVSDQTVAKMVESQVREAGNQVEVTFSVGARTYAISLNKTGEVGGRIRIAEGGRVLVDRPLTREVMSQSGVALLK